MEINMIPKMNAIWINNPRTEVTIIKKADNEIVEFHRREHALYINRVEYRVVMQDDGRIFMCGIANSVIEQEIRKDSVLHIPTGWIKNPEQYHKGINCCHKACPVHGTGRKTLGKKAPINFGAESPKVRESLGKPAESPKVRKKLGKKPIDFGA